MVAQNNKMAGKTTVDCDNRVSGTMEAVTTAAEEANVIDVVGLE